MAGGPRPDDDPGVPGRDGRQPPGGSSPQDDLQDDVPADVEIDEAELTLDVEVVVTTIDERLPGARHDDDRTTS